MLEEDSIGGNYMYNRKTFIQVTQHTDIQIGHI